MAGLNIVDILRWELNGALVTRLMGAKPGFWEIKYWIDSNIPIIRDDGSINHFITVIDGYDTNGQIAYVLDPLTGNESKVPYDSLDIFVVWIITGDHITARSDEPTIWMDSDGDGVVDFDETNRFHTDPYNNDTYGLGINDKTVIKLTYMDHLTFPTADIQTFPRNAIDQRTDNVRCFRKQWKHNGIQMELRRQQRDHVDRTNNKPRLCPARNVQRDSYSEGQQRSVEHYYILSDRTRNSESERERFRSRLLPTVS